MKENSGEKQRHRLVPMIIIFCLMVLMVLYTSRVIRDVATANIHEVGEDRIASASAQLENYLERTKSALWVTADTVDHMLRTGSSTQSILDYIMVETDHQKEEFDVNITGFYGYVSGEYLDGLAWVPPEGYDPTSRDWYHEALEAKGDITIVSPYVDAQTGSVVITICRMLSNGTDVIAIDLMMDHIQEIISTLNIKDKGFGFIINQNGMIIAHQDEEQKGRFLTEDAESRALLDKVLRKENGVFEITLDGEKQTVFVEKIVDQWYVVIAIGNQELFAEARQQMVVNVMICAIIFAMIAFVYRIGRKNERNYSRRIEEMRIEEQKQAYEARALKYEKEAAERSNQAKSDFLAEMSHEIRTPINAVLGMNEMILRECIHGGKIESYARNIESAGGNLLAIINDILDFSKIEAGKMSIIKGEYQFSSLLNDLDSMFSFKAKEKGLEYIIDVDETLPDGLYGDKVRVRQIITNLLSNAVKYTKHGYVCLMVRGDMQDPATPGQTIRLMITVKDTGLGIHEEDMEKLFDKFQRLDLDKTSTLGGTGLGLAITRSLLDMMGGHIDVESEYGVGSTFSVTVPQTIFSTEPIGDYRERFRVNVREATDYQVTFQAPSARILIVDDTVMNLTVAVSLLKYTKVQIDTATGGEEAVSLARDHAYDLILMDQRMPKMDGTEALRLIRAQADGANRETPIICLTADAVMGAKERYLAQGFTDYLPKPLDSHALEETLMHYIPEEKQIMVRKEEFPRESGKMQPGPHEQFDNNSLVAAGIDTLSGLGYCQNDESLYIALLKEYALSAKEKEQDIEKWYDTCDWNNYGTAVHAIKSTSKMIGAASVSDIAASLEEAADKEDIAFIQKEHCRLMVCYKEATAAIRYVFSFGADSFGNDEIMEFLPE